MFAAALAIVCVTAIAQAETLRIATFNAELTRRGPGLLLRDIKRGKDEQVDAFITLITEVRPDVIALQGIDYDLRRTALIAFIATLSNAGLTYPHHFTSPPNAGQSSGLDLNGNGTLGDADDAHGFGRYNGMGGMAVLSRFPIDEDAVEDFTPMLWRDLSGHIYPTENGAPFAGEEVFAAHRLSSRGHWVVPIQTPDQGTLQLMTFHATPPIYDGDEDRNGRRNHDEVAFWLDYLEYDTNAQPFILAGTANIDPKQGSGRRKAIKTLLASPILQNPFDDSPTADFRNPLPGDLRVDYLLPSKDWRVVANGMVSAPKASRHSLLWVDVTRADP